MYIEGLYEIRDALAAAGECYLDVKDEWFNALDAAIDVAEKTEQLVISFDVGNQDYHHAKEESRKGAR